MGSRDEEGSAASGEEGSPAVDASESGSGGSDETQAVNSFWREQRELTRWPYAIHAIDQSLDADLIEGRGKQLLFQSLNNRNTVAFIGSGVSMAYGRLSWKEWLTRQLDQIGENAESFIACAGALAECLSEIREAVRGSESKMETEGGAKEDLDRRR